MKSCAAIERRLKVARQQLAELREQRAQCEPISPATVVPSTLDKGRRVPVLERPILVPGAGWRFTVDEGGEPSRWRAVDFTEADAAAAVLQPEHPALHRSGRDSSDSPAGSFWLFSLPGGFAAQRMGVSPPSKLYPDQAWRVQQAKDARQLGKKIARERRVPPRTFPPIQQAVLRDLLAMEAAAEARDDLSARHRPVATDAVLGNLESRGYLRIIVPKDGSMPHVRLTPAGREVARAVAQTIAPAPAIVPASTAAPASELPPGVSPGDVPFELAERAHAGTSHRPDQRAEQEQARYVAHMARVWRSLHEAGEGEQAAVAFDEYRRDWLARYLELLSARRKLVSSMIAGPAKFPAARQKKLHDAQARRERDFLEWDAGRQRALIEKLRPEDVRVVSADRDDAIDVLKEKIAAAKQQRLRGRARVNNQANIRRMEERVAALEAERARPASTLQFDGGRVEENLAKNRVQIFFTAKPPPELRNKLKSRGFRWAPSEGAWQRQRNNAARSAVEQLLGVRWPTLATPATLAISPPAMTPATVSLPATPATLGERAEAFRAILHEALRTGPLDEMSIRDLLKRHRITAEPMTLMAFLNNDPRLEYIWGRGYRLRPAPRPIIRTAADARLWIDLTEQQIAAVEPQVENDEDRAELAALRAELDDARATLRRLEVSPLPAPRGQASMFAPGAEGFQLTVQDGRFAGVRPPESVQPTLAGLDVRPDPRALLELRVNELAARAARGGGLTAYNDVRRAHGLPAVPAMQELGD